MAAPWKPGDPSVLRAVFFLSFLLPFPQQSLSALAGDVDGMRAAAEVLESMPRTDTCLSTGPWGQVGSEKQGRDRPPFIRENWGGKTLPDPLAPLNSEIGPGPSTVPSSL